MLKFVMYRDTSGRARGNDPIVIIASESIDKAYGGLRAAAIKDCMNNVKPTPLEVKINGYKAGRISKIPYYYTLKAYCKFEDRKDLYAIYKILAYDKTPDGKEII